MRIPTGWCGINIGKVNKWFENVLAQYDGLTLMERDDYAKECKRKQLKLDEIMAEIVDKDPGIFPEEDLYGTFTEVGAVGLQGRPWLESAPGFKRSKVQRFNDDMKLCLQA